MYLYVQYEARVKKRGTQRGSGSEGRKFGLHNYSADEVEKLLDVLEEVTPIGANHWEQIGEIFEAWAKDNGYPACETRLIKLKSEKLAAENKGTGNPRCPKPVRRARIIDRTILARIQAETLGDTADRDYDFDPIVDLTNVSLPSTRQGARANRRYPGGAGVKSEQKNVDRDADLVGCVSQVAKAFSALTDAYLGRSSTRIEDVIRHEVRKAVSSSLQEIKVLLKDSTR